MTNFFIDPDIRKAHTLPSHFYTDPACFEISKEKIFARTWQFVAGPELSSTLTPVTLLPGVLDEPLLVSRGDGHARCLSNVCTHRGKVLVENACDANLIRCGYHGRRFDLDGKFLSMPEFEGVENFPSADDDLKQVPFAQRSGFCFASLDPAAPFGNFLEGHGALFETAAASRLELTARRDYEVNAHWALYCENYLEGFHIPYVHKSLNEVVDYGTYTTETFRYSSLQTALSEPPASAGGQKDNEQNAVSNVAARYLFIFPNLMFNFYPWGVSVNIVRPLSPSTTTIEFLTYVSDESLLDKGAGADLHGVEMEDEAVVESVQKGIRSRFYSNGRYSPAREQGTHHFHTLIAEFMNPPPH
ncbi:MAG: aromatic ring-hydroxylating dioxygenase subunit alpha [Acidobacteria bacterium]|nr:aromatic ring-hydroxylating dioxygenase subunit alpha [Acidobacteriota bacterium]